MTIVEAAEAKAREIDLSFLEPLEELRKAGPSTAMLLRLMGGLHSHLPEVDRPASESDFSDEQMARLRAAGKQFMESVLTLADFSLRPQIETAVAKALSERSGEEVERLRADLKYTKDRLNEFDCCMCGSLMENHDIGSGHSPVSMYDYRLDQAEAAVASLRAQCDAYKEALEPFERFAERYNEIYANNPDHQVWFECGDHALTNADLRKLLAARSVLSPETATEAKS